MKISLEGFNRIFDQAEERISKCEDRSFEIMESEEQKEKRMKKSEESLRDLQYTNKKINIYITGFQEGGDREKGAESLFEEIMATDFTNGHPASRSSNDFN